MGEEVKPSVGSGKNKGKKRVQPPPLGEVVLVTSDVEMDDDDDDLYGDAPAKKKARPAAAASTTSKTLSTAAKGKAKDDGGCVEDPDAEIARLRAELAEYKARELAQLRREKDEVERRVKAREEDEVRRAIEGRKRERREEEEVAQQLLAPASGKKRKVAQVSPATRRAAEIKREKEDADAVLVLSDGSDDD